MGIFDLIPDEKPQPAQLDIFSVTEKKTEDQEDEVGLSMR
jgi:hypothetical protein